MEDGSVATRATRAEYAPVRILVPFAASSVPVVRQRLKQWMTERGSSREHIEDARVIVSELVANAIRHARPLPDGNILITWCADDLELEVTVTDGGGPTRPRKVNAHSSALAGRGITIIETLALSWWAEQTRARSTVHARLPMA